MRAGRSEPAPAPDSDPEGYEVLMRERVPAGPVQTPCSPAERLPSYPHAYVCFSSWRYTNVSVISDIVDER